MTNLRITLQLFLAATFLFSAYTKAVAPGFFEVLLEQQGLVPSRLYGAWATRIIIAIETWLGLCLLLSFYTRFILRFSFLLLVAFSVHLGYLIAIGETGNCGCFGELIPMTPLEALIKNIFTLFILVFIYIRLEKDVKKEASNLIVIFLLISTLIFAFIPIMSKNNDTSSSFVSFVENSIFPTET